MVNAERVFELTMGLIDEINPKTGQTDTGDSAEYKARTLFLINILRGELYQYSDTYEAAESGARPTIRTVTDFEQPIELDDYICESVLPYALAAHLLLDENPSGAGFFSRRYNELKASLERGLPTVSEDVTDIYGARGGIEPYCDFSRW